RDGDAPPTLQNSNLDNAQTETEEENQEQKVILILYDSENGEETKYITDYFNETNQPVLYYNERLVCTTFIHSNQNEKIFLILFYDDDVSTMLKEVHSLNSIDSIFIFCQSKTDDASSLEKEYSKIVGVYTERSKLIKNIEENMHLFGKQSAAFNLYDQAQKATRDLSKDSGSFLFFQLFKDVLLEMPKTVQSKSDMIAKCRQYYRGNKKESENIRLFEETYKPSESIPWYTKESFLYKLVNQALRTEDVEALYTFRFYITDLCVNLAKKFRELKRKQLKQSTSVIKLYRGLQMGVNEIENLKKNVGNLMSTNGYLSTSRARQIAYGFAKKPSNKPNIEAVLFQISVDINVVEKIILADIAEYSAFPEEEEVLFDLGMFGRESRVGQAQNLTKLNFIYIQMKAASKFVRMMQQ
ncbi:unnamed protein product, partial [Didymodactylos carnosus]